MVWLDDSWAWLDRIWLFIIRYKSENLILSCVLCYTHSYWSTRFVIMESELRCVVNWNIVVCEDEAVEFQMLQKNIRQFEKESCDLFHIFHFTNGEEMLEKFPEDTHILFMDIGMKGISGMEASRRLRERGIDVCLVFITSLTQYAIEGYSVHAFGFLQKPVSYEVFRLEMKRILTALQSRSNLTLLLSIGTGIQPVDFQQVCYVEVYGRLICISRMEKPVLECRMSLSDLEKKLNSRQFFRCHNNFLVNLNAVDRIEAKQLIMKDGKSVPVSKYRYQELLSAISRNARIQI